MLDSYCLIDEICEKFNNKLIIKTTEIMKQSIEAKVKATLLATRRTKEGRSTMV